MKRILLIVAIALLALASSLQASPKSDPNCFSGMRAGIELSTMLFRMQVESGDKAASEQTAARSKADLDKDLAKVLVEAKGHPDLIRAFKEFYVATQNYYDNAWPDTSAPAILVKAGMARLEADMKAKANAMMLEAKLAGYAS